MAVQNGRDLLIKMDMTGDGLFETIAGLRKRGWGSTPKRWDVTSPEPGAGANCWRGRGALSLDPGSGCFATPRTSARQVFRWRGAALPVW